MGKADFLSPKAIGNRIKAKGLQKLRWYCQMCQKQCRDENGFKCHCMSESHQRQLLLASENPNRFMDYFSEEFKSDFLELLRRRFGTKRVHNNIVYNEYISHREHVHMNSTQWETLTDFTKWLGREGFCKVDETPKGWYMQYIDRDPETIRRQEELERKKKQDLDDEERSAKFIEEQVRRGRAGKEPEVWVHVVLFTLFRKESSHSADSKDKKKKSALEEIIEVWDSFSKVLNWLGGATDLPLDGLQMEEQKRKSVKLDHWLHPDIVVKVITKKLGEKYYKKKAVIKEVRDKYTAIVRLIDSGDKLKLDQSHLETVIPAPGKRILIVNGSYRNTEAVLEGINEKTFSATLLLDSGHMKGKKIEGIPYEDFSKLA
uniref:DNA/RNA-binding protein KIN17 n=1 Tax=Denticeps clupeoides TaxID=299321 RepID=A0AAY4E357_9TELE